MQVPFCGGKAGRRGGDDSSDTPAPSKNGKKTNGVQTGKSAAVKGKAKPTLRRRDEDEDDEDDRPQKKKSGASTTVILGGVLGLLALGLLALAPCSLWASLAVRPNQKAVPVPVLTQSSSNSGNSGPQAAGEPTPGAEVKKDEPASAINCRRRFKSSA